MTLSQRAIEAAARAVCCKAHKLGCAAQQGGSPFTACQAHTYRDDAINALEAALAVDGLALVPKDASEAMLEAAYNEPNSYWHHDTCELPDEWKNEMQSIYRAMLAAANDGEERPTPPAGTGE